MGATRHLRSIHSITAGLLLAVACGGDDAQGPSDERTVLTLGVPLRHVVQRDSYRIYTVQVTAGAVYGVSMTEPSGDTDLYVFDTDSSLVAPIGCAIDETANYGGPEFCAFIASGSTAFLAVDGSFLTENSGSYTLQVDAVPVTPLGLSVPLEGTIARGAFQIYTVPVSAGSTYVASLTGLSDATAGLVVADAGLTIRAVPVASPIDVWPFQATGTTLLLGVDGRSLAGSSAAFVVMATPAPALVASFVTTHGEIPAQVPTTGSVATRDEGFYRVLGLSPGPHRVSLVGLTGHAELYLQDGPGGPRTDGCGFSTPGIRECTVQGPDVYFSVQSGPLNRDGAGYVMLVW